MNSFKFLAEYIRLHSCWWCGLSGLRMPHVPVRMLSGSDHSGQGIQHGGLRMRKYGARMLSGWPDTGSGSTVRRLLLRIVTFRMLSGWNQFRRRRTVWRMRGARSYRTGVRIGQGSRLLPQLHRQVVLRHGIRRMLAILVRRMRRKRQPIPHTRRLQGALRRTGIRK